MAAKPRDSKAQPKAQKRRSRSPILAAILAVVALIAMWLADCIPGFGVGAGTREGEGEVEDASEPARPAEPESEPAAEPAPTPTPEPAAALIELTVDARGCMIAGGEPFDCASLCEDEARLAGVDGLNIDAKDGPQAAVEAVLDCAEAKRLTVEITRD